MPLTKPIPPRPNLSTARNFAHDERSSCRADLAAVPCVSLGLGDCLGLNFSLGLAADTVWQMVASPDNDLVRVLTEAGANITRFDDVATAVTAQRGERAAGVGRPLS